MLRSGGSLLAFHLHAAARVLGVADASAEALPVPREPVQDRENTEGDISVWAETGFYSTVCL